MVRLYHRHEIYDFICEFAYHNGTDVMVLLYATVIVYIGQSMQEGTRTKPVY